MRSHLKGQQMGSHLHNSQRASLLSTSYACTCSSWFPIDHNWIWHSGWNTWKNSSGLNVHIHNHLRRDHYEVWTKTCHFKNFKDYKKGGWLFEFQGSYNMPDFTCKGFEDHPCQWIVADDQLSHLHVYPVWFTVIVALWLGLRHSWILKEYHFFKIGIMSGVIATIARPVSSLTVPCTIWAEIPLVHNGQFFAMTLLWGKLQMPTAVHLNDFGYWEQSIHADSLNQCDRAAWLPLPCSEWPQCAARWSCHHCHCCHPSFHCCCPFSHHHHYHSPHCKKSSCKRGGWNG